MDMMDRDVEIICKNDECEDFEKVINTKVKEFSKSIAGTDLIISMPPLHCRKCFSLLDVTVR